jgi:hypothetical protein
MSLIMPNGSRTQTFVPQGYGGAFPEWQRGTNASQPAGAAPQQQAPKPAKSGGFEAYAPGRAQPIQPQSQGTPFQAYAPRTPSPFTQRTGGDNVGVPYAQPAGLPQQPFTQSAVGIDGQQYADPSQVFAQRDALIQRINEARAPMFAGSGTYTGGAAPPPRQPLDYSALLSQANNMVAGGWQNPFAPPPAIRHYTDNPAYLQPAYGYPGFPSQQPIAPPQSMPAPPYYGGPAPGYGTRQERPGGARTMDWRDNDGDGVDDRDQSGPGMHPYPAPTPNPKGGGLGNWPRRPDGGLAGREEATAQAAPMQRATPRDPASVGSSAPTTQQLAEWNRQIASDRRSPMQKHLDAMRGSTSRSAAAPPPQRNQAWTNLLSPSNRRVYGMLAQY